jgi:Tfp pilus assembly protein PilF
VLFFTSVKLDASRAAVDRGDLAQAAQDAVDARTLEPWSSEPSLQLALVDELGGDLPAARTALDEAIARAPEDWRLQLVSARLYVESNDLARARQALAKARALNPREPILQRAPREVGGGQ